MPKPLLFKSIRIDKGTVWGRKHQTLGPLGTGVSLPSAIDLRPKLDSAKIEVYNQGNLNSCTANAICTAWRYAQSLVDPGFLPSRLFVYYNERCVEGTTSEDSGAYISDGCRSLTSYGVCSEYTWPYDEKMRPTKPSDSAYDEGKGHRIHTPAQISNTDLATLKDSLAQDKPFVVGIALYPEFDNTGSDGIVPMPVPGSEVKGHHAVICVGYDDHKNHWIFRNSWGEDWGDRGHFYLPYEYLAVADHMASDFWNLATDWKEG